MATVETIDKETGDIIGQKSSGCHLRNTRQAEDNYLTAFVPMEVAPTLAENFCYPIVVLSPMLVTKSLIYTRKQC